MPKLNNQLPKMCRDRNQAFSWHKGKRIYHGRWNSPEADQSYKRFIAALLENPTLPLRNSKTGDILVSELAAGFLTHIESRMDKSHVLHFKLAIGHLAEFYGSLAVNEFSPKKLKVVRGQMVKTSKLCRNMVNDYTGRIIRIFAWGVEEELVKPDTVAALREVKSLPKGEPGTFDNPPREDVALDVIRQTLPFMPPVLRAMVMLQLLTGMRPSEVYRMTAGDIDRTHNNGLWYYVPKSHKTEKYIGQKSIPLGKPEQELLALYATSIFSMNNLPIDVEQTEAFFRRFIIVQFGIRISEEEKDTELAAKIIANEMSGVLNFVVRGMKSLLESGEFDIPPVVQNAVDEFRKESDSVLAYIHEYRLRPSSEPWKTLAKVYESYKQQCKDDGCKTISKRAVAKRLRTLGYEIEEEGRFKKLMVYAEQADAE